MPLTDAPTADPIGASPAIRRAYAVLDQAAPSDATVLIEGETGTGKSRAAEHVHTRSARAARALVVLDCGALPGPLAELELLGTAGVPGAFERAHGGTLVLDELAELPLELQARLLRILDRRAVTRAGAAAATPVDVRVIATSSRPLRELAARHRFRADLYYRLNVVSVRLPPLRERPEDVPALAASFYQRLSGGHALPGALLSLFHGHDWPGNVRELHAAVERIVVLDDVASDKRPLSFRATKAAVLARWEEQFVRAALTLARGNVALAARRVDVDDGYLRDLIKKYGIVVED